MFCLYPFLGCFGFVTGIEDPIAAEKSTCTKAQLSNDVDVEAKLYLYGAVGRQFDVDHSPEIDGVDCYDWVTGS